MRRLIKRLRRREDGERGAILVMAAAGLILMTVSSALAVDIGQVAVERRKAQAVADLAALDAVRDIANATPVARQAAVRNNWNPLAPDHGFLVEVGSVDASNVFTPGVGARAVRVTATADVDHFFAPGTQEVRAVAVASLYDEAGFSLGSSLATLDTPRITLLNRIVGPMIGGNLNLNLVSWQGLTSADFTLRALQRKLVDGGLDVGTIDQLLETDITVRRLFEATADVLNDEGLIAAATVMDSIAASANGSTTIQLGEMFDFSQGTPGSAMDMAINVFQFVTATAKVANGSNFVSVPNAGIAVPNTTNTALTLQVIEKPVFYFGKTCPSAPAAACVSTGQVQLTVTPTIDKPITILGIAGARVINALPYSITAGGADGRLEAIDCVSNPKSITVGVDPKPVAATSTGTVRLTSTVLGVTTAVMDVDASGTFSTTGTHTSLNFLYPAEFGDPGKHAGSNSLGMSGTAYVASSWTVLGALSLPAADVAAAVVGTLAATMGDVDTNVVVPLLRALGVDAGSADVVATGIKCELFGLVQ